MRLDRTAFSAPIPGGAPSGAWLRREGTYAAVQEAMRDDPGDAAYGIPEKKPDWAEVVSLCVDALTFKTKDFYLGCCLLEGLANTEGAVGIADGLWFLAELHDRFWEDFWPRPRDEGRNYDGRLNQLAAFVSALSRSLDGVPMTAGPAVLSRLDWEYAGGKLKSGDMSPWTAEQRNQAFQASSWEFYDNSVRALREAHSEMQRIDNLVDKYPADAVSLVAAKEELAEFLRLFETLLADKGPSPYVEQAKQILQQTRCTFLEMEWLAERVRAEVPLPRLLASIEGAVVDNAANLIPEEGWQARLHACWERQERYEAMSEPPPPEPVVAVDPVAPAAPAAPATAAPVAPATTAPAAAVVPPAGGPCSAILGACRALRKSTPGDPVAYMVVRYIRWRELENADRSVPLRGPPSGQREQCAALFQGENWSQLLELGESSFEAGEGVAWLDLQRYICAAMGRVGAPYGPVRAELVRGLGEFLGRNKWLMEATLADGQASADDITRNWLKVEVKVGAGGATKAGGAHPDEDEHLARATEVLEKEGIEEALDVLQQASRRARSERERSLRLRDIGEVCLRAERPELAVPVLERLRTSIHERSLDEWEGSDFLSQTLETLYRSYTLLESTSPSAEVAGRKRAVADELAQVDLNRRLRLGDPLG